MGLSVLLAMVNMFSFPFQKHASVASVAGTMSGIVEMRVELLSCESVNVNRMLG